MLTFLPNNNLKRGKMTKQQMIKRIKNDPMFVRFNTNPLSGRNDFSKVYLTEGTFNFADAILIILTGKDSFELSPDEISKILEQ